MASLAFDKQADQDQIEAWLAATQAPPRVDGLSLIEWRDFSAADDIAEWDALTAGAAEPNSFFESWALLPALVNLDRSGTVKIALFRQGGRLLGLMPIARETRYYDYPVPHACNWLHSNAFCGAPLVAKGAEHDFWRAILADADQRPGSALFLHLTHLPEDGPLFAALRDVVAEDGRPAAVVHREERALLSSDETPETYFEAAMSAKKRKELRRQHKRLAEEGTLRFHRYTDAEKIDRWCDDFLALEQAGWKGCEGSALACDPATASLFRISLHGAASRGRLERLSYSLNGKPIAMLVNYLAAPGSFSFKTAFDEDYARFSPGVLLQRENLELLNRKDIAWSDSCAAADHPMIERIWREKRSIVRVSIGIGGTLRRALCSQLLRRETGHSARGL